MADEFEQPQENKTEEPSERKKEKARDAGQIAYSREVGTTLGFMTVVLVIYLGGPKLYLNFRNNLAQVLGNLDSWTYGSVPFATHIAPSLTPIAMFCLLLLGMSFIGPVIAHILQKGTDPKFEAAAPKFDKLNPSTGVGQLLSMDTLVAFAKNLIKTIGLMLIFYLTIAPYIDRIIYIAAIDFEPAAILIGSIVGKFLIYATLFMVGVAGLDYYVSWRRIHKQLMMSRHELKEEMKDVEGNPHVRQRVRQIQMERAKRQLRKTVPKATVIVTNPTHFAIALRYKKGENPVPKVVAKGADILAKRIRELAREHRVPIVENPALARALYREVKVGGEIPNKFYKAVAKIVAAIMRLEEEKKRQIEANYHVYGMADTVGARHTVPMLH